MTTTYLGSRPDCAGEGCNRPVGWSSTPRPRDGTASAWVGRATRTSPTWTSPALHAEASTRLGWAGAQIELPPGAYETLLPPGPVADLMIYLYWTANARDAEEGHNAFAAGEAGPRSASGSRRCR